jgi:hypothetical protein
MSKKGDAEMRLTTIRPSTRNMFVTILGLFISFMVIPSSSFADPIWSIGLSGGSAGINGFTFSISDYSGIPVYINQDGPPCGQAYGYYDDYPRRDGWRHGYREQVNPYHMNRPNGYPRNDYRQDQYRQNMDRPNPHNQNYNRPNGYQQNGSIQNHQVQNIDKQKREKQHLWEMSMMN